MEELITLLENNLYLRKGTAKKQNGYWLYNDDVKSAQFGIDMLMKSWNN